MRISTWRTNEGDFDVLMELPAKGGAYVSYRELLSRSRQVEGPGFTARVAALDDIISSKEATGRPKDKKGLPELRALASQKAIARLDQLSPRPPGPPAPSVDAPDI